MQQACLEMLKGGCSWEAVHVRAHEVAIQGLLELGILRDAGGGLEEILAKRVSVAFFPHGLGHYLGMDTHDTGGNPDYDDADPMFRSVILFRTCLSSHLRFRLSVNCTMLRTGVERIICVPQGKMLRFFL